MDHLDLFFLVSFHTSHCTKGPWLLLFHRKNSRKKRKTLNLPSITRKIRVFLFFFFPGVFSIIVVVVVVVVAPGILNNQSNSLD